MAGAPSTLASRPTRLECRIELEQVQRWHVIVDGDLGDSGQGTSDQRVGVLAVRPGGDLQRASERGLRPAGRLQRRDHQEGVPARTDHEGGEPLVRPLVASRVVQQVRAGDQHDGVQLLVRRRVGETAIGTDGDPDQASRTGIRVVGDHESNAPKPPGSACTSPRRDCAASMILQRGCVQAHHRTADRPRRQCVNAGSIRGGAPCR